MTVVRRHIEYHHTIQLGVVRYERTSQYQFIDGQAHVRSV